MIKAVLFDFDMTLVDSSYAITEAMNAVAVMEGLKTVSRKEVLTVIGLPMKQSWETLWGAFDPRWTEEYRDNFKKGEYAGIKPFPNTFASLGKLKDMGISLGVASNRAKVKDVLDATGLSGYFKCMIGILDVEKPKPDPDMILKGLDLLKATKEETLYVGDTDADVISARAAGVRGIGMTTGNFDSGSLMKAGAWKTFSDLKEILTLFP